MASTSASINLVKNRGSTFFDKFIRWALTVGRTLVILTEVIALSAFLYRFSLDREIIDLHGKIKQKQLILGFAKENEETYRNVQDRLTLIETQNTKAGVVPKMLQDVISLAPSDFLVRSITVSETQIRLEATARNIQSITTFIQGLKNYPSVQAVSLDKIENKTSSGTINISISARRNVK